MVNIISHNGFFYEEIPFNTKNAERCMRGDDYITKLDCYDVEVLKTDLNETYEFVLTGIVVVVKKDVQELVKVSKTNGEFTGEDAKLSIYKKTSFLSYNDYVPRKYESCLIRLEDTPLNTLERRWEISAYDENNTFFGRCKGSKFECIPLNYLTEELLGKSISWEAFVKNKIENVLIKERIGHGKHNQ